ncbi:transcription factor WhiB [Williamsia muralis]|nr:transcription factor WhiB [Williamsia marianensis]
MESDQGVALPRPGWRDRAACVGTDPESWVVPTGYATVPSWQAAMCLRCPVLADCAADAIDHGDVNVIRAATVCVVDKYATRRKLASLLDALGAQAG